MKTRAIPVIALLLATACAPSAPLEIGSKEIPVDITLGNQAGDTPPRPPGLNPAPIGFPGFLSPPIPYGPDVLPPTVIEDPCPIANPLDASALVARASAKNPPIESRYFYRNAGNFTAGEALPVPYPEQTTRTVAEVREIDGIDNFEFDVAAKLVNDTTTTTYRVLNSGDTLDRGIYIISIVTERSEGSDAFIPETPILLMPFPPPEFGTNLEDELGELTGSTYRSSGTDPISQTTMVLEAQVVGKIRVDACGDWIDAFDIEVLSGRIVGPNKQIEFTGRYSIATQYGGLVVEDDIQMTGTDRFESIESTNRARINRLPEEPEGTL